MESLKNNAAAASISEEKADKSAIASAGEAVSGSMSSLAGVGVLGFGIKKLMGVLEEEMEGR